LDVTSRNVQSVASRKYTLTLPFPFQRLDRNIPALLEEMEQPAVAEKDHIVVRSVSVSAKASSFTFSLDSDGRFAKRPWDG
jgi:hypothetical protein